MFIDTIDFESIENSCSQNLLVRIDFVINEPSRIVLFQRMSKKDKELSN